MQLVACHSCRRQFDVANITVPHIRCHCGAQVNTKVGNARDASIHKCSSCGASIDATAEACGYCQSVIVRDARYLSLICPECFARNPERSQFCTGCGVEFDPQPIVDTTATHACPVCDLPMIHRTIAEVGAQECGACRGLWVPGPHFDDLIKQATEAFKKRAADPFYEPLEASSRDKRSSFSSEVTYRECPACMNSMARENFGRKSGIIVDRCRAHGTWLDADELEDIAAFVAGGGLARGVNPSYGGGGATHVSEERIEALLQTERIMEQARTKERKREKRNQLINKHSPLGRIFSIADFLIDLLDD